MGVEDRASQALYLVWVNEHLGLFDEALNAEISRLLGEIGASRIPARGFFLQRLADAAERATRIGSTAQSAQ
ncbi:MAG: hypothetical protein JWQ89_107 [Devosia sp.]|uniref:hypothetical protein n=1 Tax=Devosia sp. TaxID=1871048 RepID=UPI0026040B94|nr:hypothetical protein [Devosia sp.]MDB5538380.1 hypothetical protein [Devosia sp.]